MRIGALIAAWLAATAFPALAAHPFGPDDLARIAAVSDPQIDPRGEWVAYSVETTDIEADKRLTHLWMTSWDGARTVQLTGRKGESESSPRFSPDGKWLAFISGRGDAHDDDQLWLMDRAGGEGHKLPGIEGSVEDIAWSPDSKTIALIVKDPDPNEKANAAAEAGTASSPAAGTPQKPEAKPAAEASARDSDKKGDEKPPKPIVIDRFQFKEDITGYLGRQRHRLWLYDIATQTMRRATTGDYDEYLPAWSPDGRSIAFSSKRLPDPDRSYDFNLFLVSPGGTPAEPRQITTYAGADNDPEWASHPAWSPDGRRIAYLQGGPVELFSYGVRDLAVIPAAGGAPRVITAGLDRNVNDPVWSADGRSLRFSIEDDETSRIAEVSASGGPVKPVADGFRVIHAPTGGPKGRMAVLLSTPSAPDEVYALEGSSLRPLSHANDAWLREVALGTVTRTVLRSKDGTEVHGFLILPPDAKAGEKLPTILVNHGGPQSQFDAGFEERWQIMAGHGYAVVATNPRGSTGRGQEYARALYADWGGPAVPDALSAVDDAVATGVADPDRLGVMGWSYGAMLTNYVIASDTRFKAAASGAGIANILAGYGTDQYIRDYETELGRPWEHMDVWLRNSYPFYHNDRIVTPTLFMAGDKDFNVPLLNSEQMYQGLKSRGIDTQLIIYPGEYHGFTRPSFLKDRAVRWLAWFDRYLKR